MKIKEYYLAALMSASIIFIFVAGSLHFVSGRNIPQEQTQVQESNSPFKTYFKEPIVIEKQVIIYVEKEPEPIIEQEPEPYLQAINSNFDILIPSNLSEEDLIQMLDYRTGLQPLVGAFVDAEKTYGVNALYLMATVGLESGWGSSESGYNNIAGWKDFNTESGFANFDFRYDCIMSVARGISTSFNEDVGSSLYGVTGRYCPEPDYTTTLMQIMNELQNNLY